VIFKIDPKTHDLRRKTMKKFLTFLIIIIFSTVGIAFAKSEGKSKHKEKAKIEKSDKEKAEKFKEEEEKDEEEAEEKEEKVKEEKEKKEKKAKKEKGKGKKTEPPEGVQKAAEKGKGKKKGLFERWFGGSKKEEKKAKE